MVNPARGGVQKGKEREFKQCYYNTCNSIWADII